jgi:hypothetical protein
MWRRKDKILVPCIIAYYTGGNMYGSGVHVIGVTILGKEAC